MIVFLKVKCGFKVLYFELCGDMDEVIFIVLQRLFKVNDGRSQWDTCRCSDNKLINVFVLDVFVLDTNREFQVKRVVRLLGMCGKKQGGSK